MLWNPTNKVDILMFKMTKWMPEKSICTSSRLSYTLMGKNGLIYVPLNISTILKKYDKWNTREGFFRVWGVKLMKLFKWQPQLTP